MMTFQVLGHLGVASGRKLEKKIILKLNSQKNTAVKSRYETKSWVGIRPPFSRVPSRPTPDFHASFVANDG